MGRQQHRLTMFVCQLRQKLHYLQSARHIQKRRRLIEHHYRSSLGECARYHHLLTLAIRQRRHEPLLKTLHTHRTDAITHHLAVRIVKPSEKTRVRLPAQRHHLLHRQRSGMRTLRIYHTQTPGYLAPLHAMDIAPAHSHYSRQRSLLARQCAQQRALTRAVGTEHTHHLTGTHGNIHVT